MNVFAISRRAKDEGIALALRDDCLHVQAGHLPALDLLAGSRTDKATSLEIPGTAEDHHRYSARMAPGRWLIPIDPP